MGFDRSRAGLISRISSVTTLRSLLVLLVLWCEVGIFSWSVARCRWPDVKLGTSRSAKVLLFDLLSIVTSLNWCVLGNNLLGKRWKYRYMGSCPFGRGPSSPGSSLLPVPFSTVIKVDSILCGLQSEEKLESHKKVSATCRDLSGWHDGWWSVWHVPWRVRRGF